MGSALPPAGLLRGSQVTCGLRADIVFSNKEITGNLSEADWMEEPDRWWVQERAGGSAWNPRASVCQGAYCWGQELGGRKRRKRQVSPSRNFIQNVI
jgi:hypothetical protein